MTEETEPQNPMKNLFGIGSFKAMTDAIKPLTILLSILPPMEIKEISRRNLKTDKDEPWIVIYIKKPVKEGQ